MPRQQHLLGSPLLQLRRQAGNPASRNPFIERRTSARASATSHSSLPIITYFQSHPTTFHQLL
ncbi:hypothetical protein TPAR_06869 [Tolypocladium paradoxum]|uniref:Uncharacterized protein n=1 Tax=Tolypocladium paradoxum TaxID=94208 RepID=A0A2S4KS04_9HYPO|nr:hypothetical protein TPAR_06869 [Tolypocladium paradoxum]